MNDLTSSDEGCPDIDKIVQDAKELYERLVADEETTNQLLYKANFLNNTAVTMMEYQEIIEKLDEETNDRPNQNQVSNTNINIVTESRQVHQMQSENARLKSALEDHQFALELIMSKYRQQVCQFINYHRNKKQPTIKPTCNPELVHKLSARIGEMAKVMMESVEADETNQMKRDQIISQLQMENETLRELVKIALKYQSIKKEDVPMDILLNIS